LPRTCHGATCLPLMQSARAATPQRMTQDQVLWLVAELSLRRSLKGAYPVDLPHIRLLAVPLPQIQDKTGAFMHKHPSAVKLDGGRVLVQHYGHRGRQRRPGHCLGFRQAVRLSLSSMLPRTPETVKDTPTCRENSAPHSDTGSLRPAAYACEI
jgi:hypothetical protein